MTRTCPTCKKQLKESDVFFCTNCGEELTDSVINSGTSYTFRVVKFNPEGAKFSFNFKPILIGIFSLVAMIGIFMLVKVGLTILPIRPTNQMQLLPTTEDKVSGSNTINSNLDADLQKFENIGLITYVPSEVDFYLESSDFDVFYQAFTSEFSEKPFIDIFIPDVESNFIIAGRQVADNWELGLFLKVKNQDNILDKLDSSENDNWRVVLVRDTILISNSAKFIEDVVNSSNGITKNITQNPKYVTKKAQVEDKGQLLFISLSDDPNPAYSLLNYYNASTSILTISDEAKQLEYDKFVLTK